jgi:hypothetical protein
VFAINEYTAKDLQSLAATLNIAGRSKMKKDELYAVISERLDNCHAQAMEMDALRWVNEQSELIRGDSLETFEFEIIEGDMYVTTAELLAITGWKRLPRKYKKMMRKIGALR